MVAVLVFNQRVLRKAFQQSVHPTLGIRRHFQAFFYAVSFFCLDGVPPPTPARVTQTVGQPSTKNKFVFESQSWFCVWLRNSKSVFLAVAFFQICVLGFDFQQAGFQVLVSSLNKFSFISKVSGSFCRVAKIGFKVFRSSFG